MSEPTKAGKARSAFRTISEVSEALDVPQHVLRFWETKFSRIRPMKRAGGRRYYRPEDVELIERVKFLLYDKGYTIRGVQKLFKEHRSLDDFMTASDENAVPVVEEATLVATGDVSVIIDQLETLRDKMRAKAADFSVKS